MESRRFFATAPKGVADLLAAELSALGAASVRETLAVYRRFGAGAAPAPCGED